MSVQQLERPPSLGRLYAKAAVTGRSRRGGNLPADVYELNDVRINRQRLSAYNDVCGFRQSDLVPLTYPHVLAFPAGVSLMVSPSFPFPLAGMVHINNRIEQRRPIQATESVTLKVWAESLRDHPRGKQFDMLAEAQIAGESVWRETSTYLRRERRQASRSSESTSPDSASPPSPLWGGTGRGFDPTSIWRIPSDIGRRYAAVSGDVNPIHLNPLMARLFGFKRAIAHGMWVKARALSALEGRLPDRLTVEIEFKSPLLLPSTVGYRAEQQHDGWSITVQQMRTGRSHLVGRTGPAA